MEGEKRHHKEGGTHASPNSAKWAATQAQARNMRETSARAFQEPCEMREWAALKALPPDCLVKTPPSSANPMVPGDNPHPYETLDQWARCLDHKKRILLKTRINAMSPGRTLKSIAQEFGVTREGIRQMEMRTRRDLTEFINSGLVPTVAHMADEVKDLLGVAGLEAQAEHLLKPPKGAPDFRDVILQLAGPYQRERDGWLVCQAAQISDPTEEILEGADEVGRIDSPTVREKLNQWGLDQQFHNSWMLRNPSVRIFNQRLVIWGTSIPDRITMALAEMGHPATARELMEYIQEQSARTSVINALKLDQRITKIGKDEWALASWKFPQYQGTANSIKFLLERDGPCSIKEMPAKMNRTFKVSTHTAMAYCYTPMFICENGWIRLRDETIDDPLICDLTTIRKTPGVFDLGEQQLGKMMEIDRNILRGSGTYLTEAGGAILDVRVNDNLIFMDPQGNRIRITFLETSMRGPTIGSIRVPAEMLGGSETDYLTLVIDRHNMTFNAQVSHPNELTRSWETIGRMTGLGEAADLNTLAKALHCTTQEVKMVITNRQDPLLKYIPS